MSLTERSAQNLKVYMDTRGFFSSQATFEVDTTSRRRRAKVVYRTRQGEPYRIDSISYDFQDKFLEQIILPDTANTLIRPGRVFDIAVLDRERERVTAFLKERGYYNFTVNNIDYVADTLGQGSVPNPHDSFPIQTGDVKLEANLELRFPIWGMVHGATFFDLGNIWYIRRNPSEYSDEAVFFFDKFYKQLGFNTGLGLRFDIKFAVLRLDWGVQLHNPNNPAGERWIHNLRWKNTALNFGVGYPF